METAGLSLLGSLYLQRGDTVLIEDPTTTERRCVFARAGARLSSLPVGKEGVSQQYCEKGFPPRPQDSYTVTPTFQNPTGSVMPVLARKAIAKDCDSTGYAGDRRLLSFGCGARRRSATTPDILRRSGDIDHGWGA